MTQRHFERYEDEPIDSTRNERSAYVPPRIELLGLAFELTRSGGFEGTDLEEGSG